MLGERRDVEIDGFWSSMLTWSKPRLLFYRAKLSKILQDMKSSWPVSGTWI